MSRVVGSTTFMSFSDLEPLRHLSLGPSFTSRIHRKNRRSMHRRMTLIAVADRASIPCALVSQVTHRDTPAPRDVATPDQVPARLADTSGTVDGRRDVCLLGDFVSMFIKK
jgi:hypothetical protein